VTVTSDTESAGESVTLTESGSASGVFHGSIDTGTGPAVEDGILQVTDGDTIVAEYLDADDGQGGTNVPKTDSAVVDCTAPVIQDVGSQDVSDTGATVVWATDEPANSLVRYDTIAPPSQEASRSRLTTLHEVTLDGLEECTTYFYEVESGDGQGNTAVDDNEGAYYTFETYRNLPETGPVPCHQGQVVLDRPDPYGCSDTVGVTVIDVDLDTDPTVVETVEVQATSSTEPAGEWITLTEIAPSNSRFQGSVTLAGGAAVPGDGVLSVSAGDLITVTYRDLDDGIQGPYTATATSSTDCVAPVIRDVRVIDVSATRAVVEYFTDEPGTSRVEFGPTAALGQVAEDTALVTTHRLAISPFGQCDRVHFRVSSADANQDERTADAGGTPFQFNLRQIGGLVYHDIFEADTGWTLTGEWERGIPQGLGSPNADPTEDWSGSYLIGNDLSGQGSYPGDYEPSASETARSPSFSTRQRRDLELLVRRKLGVNTADEVGIYIVTGGADQVWTSGSAFNDLDWFLHRIDISAHADNKSSVQIEFRLSSFDPSHSYGWNIGEIIVKDSTQPDLLACGGCAGAPTFRGVTAVHDPDPCGPGGLVVEWQQAAAWGTGTGGTYEVYRGASAGFVPDASNRVASGLAGTSWTDASAPVDTPVWYVVRARNDESCTADGGLDDGNLVRLGATETTSRPLPSPVGETLVAWTVGGAHLRLEWTPAAGADHYVVRRATLPDFSDAADLGTTTADYFEDAGAATEPGFYGYRVFAVDACGREE
jgi:hypothetical protein